MFLRFTELHHLPGANAGAVNLGVDFLKPEARQALLVGSRYAGRMILLP